MARTFGARRRGRFLRALAATGNVSAAARAAGIARATAYAARGGDADFAVAWAAALEDAVDALELEARRRAMVGVDTPHYYGGKVAGRVIKYSDSLLMFLLRAHRPERYREVVDGGRDGEAAAWPDARARLAARLERLTQEPADTADEQEE